MLYDNNKSEDQNFWISYADLMAGLLFVFILVIGAIVVKSVYLQSDLHAMRTDLESQKAALNMSEEQLAKKKAKLRELAKQYLATQEKNTKLAMKIALLESEIDEWVENVSIFQTDLENQAESMALTQKEMDSLKALLLESNETIARQNDELTSTKTILEKNEFALTLKEGEIAQLQKALLLKKRDYQKVVEDLNITKTKIKSLTGIKVKVVQALKEKLGNKIHVEKKSGAIRFSSNVLFKQREYTLNPNAKNYLRNVLTEYFDVLLKNKEFSKYIDTIVIEGHTNSDGSYMYNLELSQKRAFAVMEYLYGEFPENRELFIKYLTASGRSYAEPILDTSGKEDKDASRRIEIKFYIKNNAAIQELKNYFGS